MKRVFVVLLGLSVTGCGAGWRRSEIAPRQYPARQQIQIWQARSMLQWHAVRISNDSISGVLFTQPIDCDSCRLSVPRATVDSIRLGDPVSGFWSTFAAIVGGFFAALVIICRDGCPNGG